MIFVINQRGIATEVPTIAEAKRLRSIHGWMVALGYMTVDDPSMTWKMAAESAEAESLQRLEPPLFDQGKPPGGTA